MKAIATTCSIVRKNSIVLTSAIVSALAAALLPAAARADEFLAMPGLWQTTYEVEGTTGSGGDTRAGESPPASTPRAEGSHTDVVHADAPRAEGQHADVVRADAPRVVWHCVDEAADPWVSFAQLQDLPGMTCKASSRERNSTSLKWQMQCHGPGPEAVADVIEVSGAIIFDSPQHYRGWVKFSGTLMGYPLHSSSKVEGRRKAACTSPSD